MPWIALPTTAGTGSEATKNAVISSFDPPFKKSLRSDQMLARAVIVDPQLAVSVPADVTAHTGMDAITQLIESYISRKARPLPRALAIEALPLRLGRDCRSRRRWHVAPREAMAHAALLSGMALANSGLGMAHGVAAALGANFRVSHGLACAVMLPVALRVNRATCEQPLAELARAVGIEHRAASDAAEAFIERIEAICQRIGIPRLSELGVTVNKIPDLVRDSRGNSMDGNPRSISDDELAQILEARL